MAGFWVKAVRAVREKKKSTKVQNFVKKRLLFNVDIFSSRSKLTKLLEEFEDKVLLS